MRITIPCLLLLIAIRAHATTIAVTSGFDQGIVVMEYPRGEPRYGYYIGVGSYDVEPVVTDWISMFEAAKSFNEFAAGVSPVSGKVAGLITGSFTGIPSNPSLYNKKEIYVLVGNGETRSSSSSFAILKGVNPWTFPDDVIVAGATTITLRNAASFTTVYGLKVDVADPAAKDQLILGVPETSSSVLIGLFGLGLISRRRR